jgi:hypothetical protein
MMFRPALPGRSVPSGALLATNAVVSNQRSGVRSELGRLGSNRTLGRAFPPGIGLPTVTVPGIPERATKRPVICQSPKRPRTNGLASRPNLRFFPNGTSHR